VSILLLQAQVAAELELQARTLAAAEAQVVTAQALQANHQAVVRAQNLPLA